MRDCLSLQISEHSLRLPRLNIRRVFLTRTAASPAVSRSPKSRNSPQQIPLYGALREKVYS